jgi:uncharacterized protein YbjT (DUF2867 family)
MRVLITGGSGFIGRHVTAALRAAGYDVIAATRRPAEMQRRFPGIEAIHADFNRDVSAAVWRPRLADVDAVVNCAGILQQHSGQSIDAIHVLAPLALYEACVASNVRRIVHVSAVSADIAAGTAYANTKRQAEEQLATLDIDWVILRPSLVFGSGSYGGTSLLRGLAALPFAMPMIGRGEQSFQPIHMDDLVATVLRALTEPTLARRIISPVGPETMTLRQIVQRLRAWLNLRPVPIVPVPLPLVRLVARFGDWSGDGPMNTTALRQLQYGNVADPKAFIDATGIAPRRMDAVLSAHPSQVQDRWHARLYFLRPALRYALALLWIVSGLVGLAGLGGPTIEAVMAIGFSAIVAPWAAAGACLVDIGLGLGLILRWRPRILAAAQIFAVVAYTVVLSFAQPNLWLDLYGPLLKNVPILVAILVWAVLENDR